MTDSQRNAYPAIAEVIPTQPDSGLPEHVMYTYESAGITERKGNVPVWLWIVVVSLLIWGVYYLVTYWNAPVTPA